MPNKEERKIGWILLWLVGISVLIRDAIASGQIVLVVDAQRTQEAATAREVIQASGR